jgi:hypothetical protein
MNKTISSEIPDIDELSEPWSAGPSRESTNTPASKILPYLRGPIPWYWLRRATELGESALATGLAVWHLRALNKKMTFEASLNKLRKWTGLSEKSTRNGLHRLESAGLLEVERPQGKNPSITLVDIHP